MRRLRPLVIVIVTVITILPSLVQTVTQNLSAISVLTRLAVSLFLIGSLVWIVTAVMVHYARIQARRHVETFDEAEMN